MLQPEPLQQRSLRPNFAGGVILSPLLKANAIVDPYSKVCRTTYPVKGLPLLHSSATIGQQIVFGGLCVPKTSSVPVVNQIRRCSPPWTAGLSHVREHIDEEAVVPGSAFELASQGGL